MCKNGNKFVVVSSIEFHLGEDGLHQKAEFTRIGDAPHGCFFPDISGYESSTEEQYICQCFSTHQGTECIQ